MFSAAILQNDLTQRLGAESTVEPTAKNLFERALRTGRRKRYWASVRGQSRALLSLDTTRRGAQITHRHHIGTQIVPLSAIAGSVDKTTGFDVDFLPTSDRNENRWVRVATAMLRGLTLPPVELIRVGETYFVVDGHHRISVARSMDHTHVDAVVTVWETA
jgi:hypothetical protein